MLKVLCLSGCVDGNRAKGGSRAFPCRLNLDVFENCSPSDLGPMKGAFLTAILATPDYSTQMQIFATFPRINGFSRMDENEALL
jgi:hypothetical protein